MAELTTESELQKAVVKKFMIRLIPFLSLLYAFCIIDRTNVTTASIDMTRDLKFSNTVYGMGAGLFFIGYFLFEVPSNLIMERVGARRWIARIMFTWGIISCCFMMIKTPASFYSLRFLLGIAEAGFYPGILLYLTYWVPALLRARIVSRFLALTAVLSLVSAPLGSYLLTLKGVLGLKGWQWLFLLEGLPSALLGFAVLFFLEDQPRHAKWLTDAEKDWVERNVARDTSLAGKVEHLTLKTAFTEPRILLLCLVFLLQGTGNNALGFFTPKVLTAASHGNWSSSFIALILGIPAMVGALAMVLAAEHSDRSGRRRLHVVFGYCFAGVAMLAMATLGTTTALMVCLCLIALGERIAAASYWAMTANLLGVRAAAGGIAMINSIGSLGGFIGPNVMGVVTERNHNHYGPGLAIAATLMFAGGAAALFLPADKPRELNATKSGQPN
jgi:ACS family tartrate transporter-like MFS transporter